MHVEVGLQLAEVGHPSRQPAPVYDVNPHAPHALDTAAENRTNRRRWLRGFCGFCGTVIYVIPSPRWGTR